MQMQACLRSVNTVHASQWHPHLLPQAAWTFPIFPRVDCPYCQVPRRSRLFITVRHVPVNVKQWFQFLEGRLPDDRVGLIRRRSVARVDPPSASDKTKDLLHSYLVFSFFTLTWSHSLFLFRSAFLHSSPFFKKREIRFRHSITVVTMC